jgi:RNA polymerase sigma factor for flagellar operon FliA
MTSTSPSLGDLFCVQEEGQSTPQELWRQYSKRDLGGAAEDSLIKRYLPLVKAVAGRVAMSLPSHVGVEDLYSAGLVGLLDAVRRFDPTDFSFFEAYARVRIRGAIFDELRHLDWVPRSVHDKARKVEQTRRDLHNRNGAVPTDEQMARALDISPREYDQLLETLRPKTFICLDAMANNDGENDGGRHGIINDESQINPRQNASLREMASLVEERLKELPEKQRKVLALYYFEDLRLREIAEAFGLSESRICQIHAQAIQGIQALLRKEDPEVFSHPLQSDS